MSRLIDQDGTPIRALYHSRVEPRLIAEMLGMAKGILADGIVTEGEASALKQWVTQHPDIVVGFPGRQVADRLLAAFADGRIDSDEQEDLRNLLLDLTGEEQGAQLDLDRSTRLPLDDPLPTLTFDGWEFVFTGQFASGSRRMIERRVTERGGTCCPRVTKRTDVLVIGTFASPAWTHASHGRKIEQALAARDAGSGIRIVPESHWLQALETGP